MPLKHRTTIAVLLTVLTVFSVLIYRHATGVTQARTVEEIASEVINAWGNQSGRPDPDFHKLSIRMRGVSETLDRATTNMTPGIQIASSARWVPVIGDRIGARIDLFEVARNLLSGGQKLAEVASDLSDSNVFVPGVGGGLPSINPELLDQLQNYRAKLLEAREQLQLAREGLDNLARSEAGLQYLNGTGDVQSAIRLMESLVGLSLLMVDHGSDLLGFGDEARYVIVAINADELRAGGGFSPGFWNVRIADGRILEATFFDSFEVGATGPIPVTPPIDMLQSMWAGGWFLPDAAWYPDTERTASYIRQVLEQNLGIDDIEAIVFVDQWAARSFLSVIGEATLDDGRFVDADSFFELLQERTDAEGRKYLATVFNGLLNSFSSQDVGNSMGPLLFTMFETLSSRHMQVRFADDSVQNEFKNAGFTNVLTRDAGSDYLFVADSNVGFSKVNRNISRELRYVVDLRDPAKPSASLTIRHRNLSIRQEGENCDTQDARIAGAEYSDSMNACYWNLVQVYVPSEVELLVVPSFPMPDGALYRTVGYNDVEDTLRISTERDLMAITGLSTVEAGDAISHTFEYDLPPQFVVGDDGKIEYNLAVPKQAGLRNSTVVIDVLIPDGFGLEFADPLPLIVSDGHVIFEESQDRDLNFSMIFSDFASGLQARNFRPVPNAPRGSPVAFIDISILGSAPSPELTSARIAPSVIRIAPGASRSLTASGIDQNGRLIEGVSVRWVVNNPQAGVIDRNGLFTASGQSGIFKRAVEVTITRTNAHGTRTTVDFATVEIFDPALDVLDRVVAYPPEIRATSGQIVALRAIPWTAGGRISKDAVVDWRINDETIGVIDSFGFLKVSATPGIYTSAVSAVFRQPGREGNPDIVRETSFTFIVPSVKNFNDLARAMVLPGNVYLRGGESFRFVPRAFTDRAAVAEDVEWRWELSNSDLGSIDLNGVFLATDTVSGNGMQGIVIATAIQSTSEGKIEVSTFATISLLPPIVEVPLEYAEITGGTVKTTIGSRILLSASGYSAGSVRLARLVRRWTVIDPRAGRIQAGGTFVAGRTPGTYENVLQLRLIQRLEDGTLNIATASVTVVIASDVERVVIKPVPVPIARGQTIRLEATTFDEEGREVSGVGLVWHVLDPKTGLLRPGGVFTAGSLEGQYSNAIRVYVAPDR